MRAARLIFCLAHADWTLEDWKRVIWSDETSVILGQRRGSIRIWRNVGDAYENSCIRRRWKGFTEFMFWGCFCWDKKGPCHIWTKETPIERKETEKELEELNITLEPTLKRTWETENVVRRINLRQRFLERKLKWRLNKVNDKLVRDDKVRGIDWYRYWILFLFASFECLIWVSVQRLFRVSVQCFLCAWFEYRYSVFFECLYSAFSCFFRVSVQYFLYAWFQCLYSTFSCFFECLYNTFSFTNFYRYWKHILLFKFISFTKECQQIRSDILVQENNVPLHIHRYQERIYKLYKIVRLLWSDNFPDLNVTKPVWY